MQFLGKKRIPTQKCPLCGEVQDVIIEGMINEYQTSNWGLDLDHGYSFCNCHSIFFTDWSNIDQSIYRSDIYFVDYLTNEAFAKLYSNYIKNYFDRFLGVKSFLEIGCANESLLEEGLKRNWEVLGIDMYKRKTKNNMIFGDFEKLEIKRKFDVIWASHVFEHFKNPIQMLKKCFALLNPNGYIFIAMPDPLFIPWDTPFMWGHWMIKEHHILWDMDSFIGVMKKKGFEVIMANHIVENGFPARSDFHIIGQKWVK